MRPRYLTGVVPTLLVLAIASAALFAQAGKPSGAATPQAAAGAVKSANDTKNFLGALPVLAPDALKEIAGEGVTGLLMVLAFSDQFVSLGLPATCLTDLREAVEAFEGAMADRRIGRAGEASAKAGIKVALAAGSDAARTLDIVVRNTAGHDRASARIAGPRFFDVPRGRTDIRV